jgi:two-component system phosphate regulon response regulator PhoB
MLPAQGASAWQSQIMESTAKLDVRVLVVEDEEDLQRLLVFNLRAEGFIAEGAGTGQDAIALATTLVPHVVVLDWMLPDILGTAVCSALRAREETHDAGVLMLTARTSERDRIEGLESGVDDYVAKPFSVREVVLRVRTLARKARDVREAKAAAARVYCVRQGAVELDLTTQRVSAAGHDVQLRPLEFKLLATLVTHAGRTLGRAELLDLVWGLGPDSDTRTIDTHVRRLREKLGESGSLIETVHGSGYRVRAA